LKQPEPLRIFIVPAYIIVTRLGPVRDAEAIAEYSRLNRENAAEFRQLYNITPLVVYGTVEALEGPAPDGVIMLQFPTMADAKAWYDSPGYQKALEYRRKAGDYHAIIVEGIQ
jgi:uncharacterized protein (DUF1330 family)